MKQTLIPTLLTACFSLTAQAQNIFIDFGGGGSAETAVAGWNNVTGVNTMVSAASLLDFGTQSSSGISYQITDAFQATNGQGGESEIGNFVGTATQDSFYGSDSNASAVIVFSGFDINTAYDFTFVAARKPAADNRSTKFDLAGILPSSSVDVNASIPSDGSISSSNVGSVSSVFSDASGNITLTVSKGASNDSSSGFFYLGAMQITAIPEPSSYAMILGGMTLGLVGWRRRSIR